MVVNFPFQERSLIKFKTTIKGSDTHTPTRGLPRNLMRPNKAETAVHGCHCPGDMAVRIRKVLARPWVGVRVCHLLLLLFNKICSKDKLLEKF